MSFTRDLLEGVAQLLAAEAVAQWSPTGLYAASQTGIVVGGLPQIPDRVVALAMYGVSDDPSLSDSTVGLQVTTRWGGQDPRPADDLADAVFDALHGRHDHTLATGVHLVQLLHRSRATLGRDGNDRWRTVSNFYVTAHRPSPHRT